MNLLKFLKTVGNATVAQVVDDTMFNTIYIAPYAAAAYKDQTVVIPKPIELERADLFDGQVKYTDVNESSAEIKVDQLYTKGIVLPDIDLATTRPEAIDELAIPLADSIKAAIRDTLNKQAEKAAHTFVEDRGFTYNTLVDAKAALKKTGSRANQLYFGAGIDASAGFSKDTLLLSSAAKGSDLLKEDYLGKVSNIEVYQNHDVSSIETDGTFGLKGGVTLEEDSVAGNKLSLKGPIQDGTLAVGDVIKVGGKSFTVVAASTASLGVIEATVKEQVTLGLLEGAPVTIKHAYDNNILYAKNSIALVSAVLSDSGVGNSVVVDLNGIKIRIEIARDIDTQQTKLVASALFGIDVIYPEHMMKVV